MGWYAGQQARLRAGPVARLFHECRTDAQHLGLNPVVGGYGGKEGWFYHFGQPAGSTIKFVPDLDLLTACRYHMRTICEIVDAAYQTFGLLIDPDQIYTPEGLFALGWTVEDVEAELGFPRGYTDIPWDGGHKEDHRLALLRRRSIPGSGIKPLLAEHLGRELAYPTQPFRAPE